MSRGVCLGGGYVQEEWVCLGGMSGWMGIWYVQRVGSLTPSGSYHMYSCQGDSTHPIGMLSCDTSDCHVIPGFAVAAQF